MRARAFALALASIAAPAAAMAQAGSTAILPPPPPPPDQPQLPAEAMPAVSVTPAPTSPALDAMPPGMPQPSGIEEPYGAPGAGRVPLIVESEGVPQQVGLAVSSVRFGDGFGFGYGGWGHRGSTAIVSHTLCRTPCTLWVSPGEFPLVTGGDGVRQVVNSVPVFSGGLRLRVRAPSSAAFGVGVWMMGGGLGLTALGLAFLAVGTNASAANPEASLWTATGGVTGAFGVAFAIVGTALVVSTRAGIASATPLGPVRVGLGPNGTRIEF